MHLATSLSEGESFKGFLIWVFIPSYSPNNNEGGWHYYIHFTYKNTFFLVAVNPGTGSLPGMNCFNVVALKGRKSC